MDFSIAFLANIDAAAKERDATIYEKSVVARRQELLDKIEAYKVTMDGALMELEIRAVDRYKMSGLCSIVRSPTFDGVMHQEYANRMRESYTFLKDNVAPALLGKLENAILVNKNEAHCQIMRLPLLDMHIEVSPKYGKPTYFTAGKEDTLIMGARADEGPIHG
ncbi:hypothetical protein ACOSQ3_014698 [Xanthoceras sorbifolium]